jgi:hypothetical protein
VKENGYKGDPLQDLLFSKFSVPEELVVMRSSYLFSRRRHSLGKLNSVINLFVFIASP